MLPSLPSHARARASPRPARRQSARTPESKRALCQRSSRRPCRRGGRFQTGAQWPMTAPVPAAYVPLSPASARPASDASAPLRASPARTTAPHFQPRILAAFNVPGLPVPVARRSIAFSPFRFAAYRLTTSAVGNVPATYPASPAAATLIQDTLSGLRRH